MPSDLLHYLSPPAPYSPWWLVLGVAVLAAVLAWFAGVLVWTLPARSLRRVPVLRRLHDRLVRRKFAGAVRGARARYRAGELSPAQAAAAIRHALRGFLAVMTGDRVHYMHVGDMAGGELASAAPVFSALNDAQFDNASHPDLNGLGHEAEELIRSWT